MSITGMWTIGSVIKGVKIGICCDVGIDMGNRTIGSGKKGGISSRLRLGSGVKSEARGGNVNDSAIDMGIIICEGATAYWRADATGEHQL
ncbi:hypothetical protein HanPSC8_Chr07g0302171 [Helianthus annuus]|nr:hypothetical protein HanPSC8_Chr07g0302171 [Helianthus annuus]